MYRGNTFDSNTFLWKSILISEIRCRTLDMNFIIFYKTLLSHALCSLYYENIRFLDLNVYLVCIFLSLQWTRMEAVAGHLSLQLVIARKG